MCEYPSDASSNLDCLDDILTIDEGRTLSSSDTTRQHHSAPPPRDDHDAAATNTTARQDQQQVAATVGQRSGSVTETGRKAARRVEESGAATSGDGGGGDDDDANRATPLGDRPPDFGSSSPASDSAAVSLGERKLFKTDIGERNKAGQMSWRDDHLMSCMLITANVGTIFEESTLLDLWFKQLKSYLAAIKPQLVAIHCQEVGGKNYETSMRNVSKFTDQILGDQAIIGDYSRVRIFLDENFQCLEKFTALGSLYLIHDSMDNVKLYNFKTAQYDLVEDQKIFAVSDEDDLKAMVESDEKQKTSISHQTATTTKTKARERVNGLAEHVEKVKFPPEVFPECRWSRKGFMRTRWMFNNCQPLDLVNIHLFHDASNLIAMKATPSPYAQTRQKALEYTLKRISLPLQALDRSNNNVAEPIQMSTELGQVKDGESNDNQVPLFIFGDFNFRLDTNGVIQRITEGVSPVVKKSSDSDEVLEFVYHRKETGSVGAECDCSNQRAASRDPDHGSKALKMGAAYDEGNRNRIEDDSGVVMTIGKKLFDCQNLDEMFRAAKNTEWLLELDNELDSFKNKLHEFRISFSPSYPFKEDETGGHSYMKTRCPSWCDRILFNSAGNKIIYGKNMVDEENLDGKKRIERLQGQGDVIYRLMGNSVPMGDHKPVLLYCRLKLSPFGASSKCNATGIAISESPSGLLQTTTT